MILLTIFALFVVGCSLCGGILLLFMQRKLLGISLMGLSLIAYITYQYVANSYFV